MPTALSEASRLPELPDRIWVVNTEMNTFHKFPRSAGDTSAFAHWLAARRLFVSPSEDPDKYAASLESMAPGDPVFAYENKLGVVALGWIMADKDLVTTAGGTALYPNPDETVRSLAVRWDPTVTRSASVMSKYGKFGRGLFASRRGSSLHGYLSSVIVEGVERTADTVDELEAQELARIETDPTISAAMRVSLTASRIGQGRFRQNVLRREPRCRLTGIDASAYLVASHIKPWYLCEAGQHLDGANGLMLAPHADLLFDSGLISFTDSGLLLVAPSCDVRVLQAWHIDPNTQVGQFDVDQAAYLAFHRRFVFGQRRQRKQRNLVGERPAGIHDPLLYNARS